MTKEEAIQQAKSAGASFIGVSYYPRKGGLTRQLEKSEIFALYFMTATKDHDLGYWLADLESCYLHDSPRPWNQVFLDELTFYPI